MTDNCENVEADIPAFRVPFGVGYWDFGLRYDGPVPFTLDLEQYITRLRAGLEADPSLNNLEIVPWPLEETIFTQSNLRETDTGPAIFPGRSLSLHRIKFDLHIPRRYHRELTEPFPTELETESIRFHVHYPFYGPVCFVELIDTDTSSDPSTAIVVARRYMERWLNKTSNEVVFTTIGPSPFHANFYIEGHKTPNNTDREFEYEILKTRGYADVTFRCCTEQYETAMEARSALFYAVEPELDLFYEIQRRDSESYRQWDDVQQLASDVIEQFKMTGWAQFPHTLTRGRKLAALRISLVEFEEGTLSNDHALNTAYRRLYGGGRITLLKSFLDEDIKNRDIFPTKQRTDLIDFIERRRSKSIEFLIVLIASLIGGIAGAIITSISR